MSKKISRDTYSKMIDLVLDDSSVPRRFLFEYPYNEFESRKILRDAEKVVDGILALIEVKVSKKDIAEPTQS